MSLLVLISLAGSWWGTHVVQFCIITESCRVTVLWLRNGERGPWKRL